MIHCKKKGCGHFKTVISGFPIKIELHHLVPRCIGGTDEDGRVYLCKKHHDILGKIVLGWVWDFVPEVDRDRCRAVVAVKSRQWLEYR